MCSCSLVPHGFCSLFCLQHQAGVCCTWVCKRDGEQRGAGERGTGWETGRPGGDGVAKGMGDTAPDAPFPCLRRWPE